MDYVVLDGNTSLPNVWSRLTKLLNTRYRHASGAEIGIVRLAVDSGFATQEVYAWARQHGSGQILVVKGYPTGTAPIGQPNAVEVNYGGKKIKTWCKGLAGRYRDAEERALRLAEPGATDRGES